MSEQRLSSFAEFYPYYLAEHDNIVCRRLHFIGTSLVILIAAASIITQQWSWLWALPFAGYGFAWVGHFFYERNKPATFKYPFYSLLGDFVMYRDIWLKRVSI